MNRPVRSALVRLGVLAALSVALVALTVTAAVAAPAVVGLEQLEQLIEDSPSGSITGYFRTVTKGSEISTIPVEVLAVTGDADPGSALILFEASGDQIKEYGGIVSGMSGSPVYVEHEGVNKLIGAVSYGDVFTLNGTGLATPIESMIALQDNYEPRVQTLSRPVMAGGGVIKQVVVSPNPEDFEGASEQGVLVAEPLNVVYVAGIDPKSPAFAALDRNLKAQGVSLAPIARKLGAGIKLTEDGEPWETDLVAGSSIGVLAARGDLWLGGIGTVTYGEGEDVLAFGHPAYWDGESHLYMTNAWIDGIWPSSQFPYKLGRPGAVRGTITQDRMAGIRGQLGYFESETTVTGSATNVDTGITKTSKVLIPRGIMNSPLGDPSIAAYGAYIAPANLFDQWLTPGSAITDTTIKVSDGNQVHQVNIHNVFDDNYDVAFYSVMDAYNALMELAGAHEYGLEDLDILSVNVSSKFSAKRKNATVADVELPNGLKVGKNTVRIKLLAYGETAPKTVYATLTIPQGTPLSGEIAVFGNGGGFDEWAFEEEGPDMTSDELPSRPTIKQIVESLNDRPANDDLILVYYPEVDMGEEEEPMGPVEEPEPIEAVQATPWYVSGYAEKTVTKLTARVTPSTTNYYDMCFVHGTLSGAESGVVKIYGTQAGSTEKLLATAEVMSFGEGAEYEALIGPLRRNTSIRVAFAGDDESTASQAKTSVKVRAKVVCRASMTRPPRGQTIRLSAALLPDATAGRTVVFERYYRGAWRPIHTSAARTLVDSGSIATASVKYRPPVGTTKVRVRFLGGPTNAPTNSSAITLVVK